MTIRIIRDLCSIHKRIFFCAIFVLFFSCMSYAVPVDTIKTDNAETILLLGEKELTVIKDKQSSIYYQPYTEYSKWPEMKASLDSCIWQNYYEGKIGQGHARFLFFILFNRKGDIEEIYFSQPLSVSDDAFYINVISVIRDAIRENHYYKKSRKHKWSKSYFYSLYKINLYP